MTKYKTDSTVTYYLPNGQTISHFKATYCPRMDDKIYTVVLVCPDVARAGTYISRDYAAHLLKVAR